MDKQDQEAEAKEVVPAEELDRARGREGAEHPLCDVETEPVAGSSVDDAEDEEEDGYYVIPEESTQYLPDEWRTALEARAEEGRRVLALAAKELKQLSRLSLSYYHVVVLRHVRDRLAECRFKADMEALLELDMLTTAFLATYVRLYTGGGGSGFARDALPTPLRAAHDEIIDLRNKRYAHVDEHHSVNDEMEIAEEDGRYVVTLGTRLGVYIGGSNDWPKLVDALDDIFADRGAKIIARLEARTGREWMIAQGSAPDGHDDGGGGLNRSTATSGSDQDDGERAGAMPSA
ncbi:hypothetical protein GCM10008023_36480 [Sphingomonas glacialis]|uniref:HEPN AbiU2-like domain-containing protein n=1 Tax=Sphingomonas glacialis TaxID=658225 RepID=A0ABQ3LRR9_9SPHN|nr:hypothetical protein [Sphingomonas glacialis]GHH24369.1 hypothetical protein GCM10008023_36480 [Sphingomonas glacialis]